MKTMFTSTQIQNVDSNLKDLLIFSSFSNMSEKQVWQWFHNGCRKKT